jgi:hypothetical protein
VRKGTRRCWRTVGRVSLAAAQGRRRLNNEPLRGMAPIASLRKINIASDLVGDTGIEPVTSSA